MHCVSAWGHDAKYGLVPLLSCVPKYPASILAEERGSKKSFRSRQSIAGNIERRSANFEEVSVPPNIVTVRAVEGMGASITAPFSGTH